MQGRALFHSLLGGRGEGNSPGLWALSVGEDRGGWVYIVLFKPMNSPYYGR